MKQAAVSRYDLARSLPLGLARLATNGKYGAPRHLRLIQDAYLDLRAAETGGRLAFVMPPQHGKSETVSHWIASWDKGTWPEENTGIISYEETKAAEWGQACRDTVAQWGPRLWGVGVDAEQATKTFWKTTQGGKFLSAGIGGPLVGHGLHLGIIDDPTKNWQEADSPTYQERNLRWRETTFLSRLRPSAIEILIMTRWNERDLIGAVVEQNPDEWGIIRLPAVAEEPSKEYPDPDPLGRAVGEPLWPEQRPLDFLMTQKKSGGPSTWAGVWQGRPAPEQGAMFKAQYFDQRYRIEGEGDAQVVVLVPKEGKQRRYRAASLERFICTDAADTTGSSSAYTAMGAWLVTPEQELVLWDVLRVREEEAELKSLAKQLQQRHGGVAHIERASYGKSITNALRKAGLPVREFNPQGSKVVRARTAEAKAASREIWLPEAAPWLHDYLDEVTRFPKSRYADQVDITSHACIILADRRVPGVAGD